MKMALLLHQYIDLILSYHLTISSHWKNYGKALCPVSIMPM
jgi:hypothetical protein